MSLGQPEAKQGYLRSTSAAMPSPLLVGSASRYWFASRGTPACTTKASTQLLTWVSEHTRAVRTKPPGGDRSGRVHLRWTRKIGQEVKLGLLLRRMDLNDGQTEAVFGGFQGEGCS